MANDIDRSAGLVAIGVLNVIFGALGIIFYILVIIAGFEASADGGTLTEVHAEAAAVEQPDGSVTPDAYLEVDTESTAQLEWRGWVGLVLCIGLFISGFGLLAGIPFGAPLANLWAVSWIIWQIIAIIIGLIGWFWFIICGLIWPIIVLIVVNTAEGDDVFNQPATS